MYLENAINHTENALIAVLEDPQRAQRMRDRLALMRNGGIDREQELKDVLREACAALDSVSFRCNDGVAYDTFKQLTKILNKD